MARARHDDDTGSPGLADRLLAAVLAPIVFNLSLLVVTALFLRRVPLGDVFLSRLLLRDLRSLWLVLLLTVVAVVAGFLFGTRGFALFLGHAFYTHTESQRSLSMTAFIWAAIALLAYDLSTML